MQAKQRDRYLVGFGYKDYLHYWVPLNGDFGLHDAPWQSMAFGSKNLAHPGLTRLRARADRDDGLELPLAAVGSTVVTIES